MLRFFSFLFFVQAVVASPSKSLSASIKDASLEGLSGFGLTCDIPFQIDDYTVGVRHNFDAPVNKGPESVYASKKFELGEIGSIKLDADYAVQKNVFSLAAKWASEKYKLALGLDGNTADKLRSVEISSADEIQGNKLAGKVSYDLLSKKIAGHASVSRQDTTVQFSYDTENKDPVLQVIQDIDENNSIRPTVSLKTGKNRIAWIRKWTGGSLATTLQPLEKQVDFEWSDASSVSGSIGGGVWRAKASVPLTEVKDSKLTVSRDWNY